MLGDIVIYENTNGNIKIDVRLEDETVWITQDQMAILFNKAKSTINEHIKIFMQKMSCLKLIQWRNSEIPNFSKKHIVTIILMLLFQLATE